MDWIIFSVRLLLVGVSSVSIGAYRGGSSIQQLVLDTNPRILWLIVCCPCPLWWCLTALKMQSEEEILTRHAVRFQHSARRG